MKWLLMVVALVLGATITWFLSVRRVTRTVPASGGAAVAAEPELAAGPELTAEPELAPVVSPGEPVAGAVGVAGGADLAAAAAAGVLETEATATADSSAEREDDDASRFGGSHTTVSEAPVGAEVWDRDAQDEDALLSAPSSKQTASPATVPPVADATPTGDVAGVGDPEAVATVDEQVVDSADEAEGSVEPAPSSADAIDRPTQGRLTFDDDEDEPPAAPDKSS